MEKILAESYYQLAIKHFHHFVSNRTRNTEWSINDFTITPYYLARVIYDEKIAAPYYTVVLHIDIDDDIRKVWQHGTYSIGIHMENESLLYERIDVPFLMG